MQPATKPLHSWEAAKWVVMTYLLSWVCGWLGRALVNGKINDADRAALFILLATIGTIIAVFCTLGVRRWRRGELLIGEKVLMCASLVLYVVFFILGWNTDIG